MEKILFTKTLEYPKKNTLERYRLTIGLNFGEVKIKFSENHIRKGYNVNYKNDLVFELTGSESALTLRYLIHALQEWCDNDIELFELGIAEIYKHTGFNVYKLYYKCCLRSAFPVVRDGYEKIGDSMSPSAALTYLYDCAKEDKKQFKLNFGEDSLSDILSIGKTLNRLKKTK